MSAIFFLNFCSIKQIMEVDEDTIMHDSAADGDAADTVVVDRVPRVSPPAAEPAAAAGGASAMDVDAVADQERERDRDEEVAVTTENAATVSSVGEPSHAEPAAVDTQEGEAGEAKSESAKAPARKKRLTPAAMLRAALAEKIFLPAGMYSEYYKVRTLGPQHSPAQDILVQRSQHCCKAKTQAGSALCDCGLCVHGSCGFFFFDFL